MLRVILDRLKAKAEQLLTEDQAGFRPGRSTVKLIFNSCHYREAPSAPARSISQLHWLQEGLWQSLAYRPVPGLQKLQHRKRTGSSHSGTSWNLQQSSPLEELARGVLQDNRRCPSGMLTLIQTIQLVPREDHAGDTPWPSYVHLHWWKAIMQHMICRRHRFYGRQQWWTWRPHQQTRRQSSSIWNGCQHRKEQDHDQQHEQHQCWY